MTKAQLRTELFLIKNDIRDALLNEMQRTPAQSALYLDMLGIWRTMNQQDYR